MIKEEIKYSGEKDQDDDEKDGKVNDIEQKIGYYHVVFVYMWGTIKVVLGQATFSLNQPARRSLVNQLLDIG